MPRVNGQTDGPVSRRQCGSGQTPASAPLGLCSEPCVADAEFFSLPVSTLKIKTAGRFRSYSDRPQLLTRKSCPSWRACVRACLLACLHAYAHVFEGAKALLRWHIQVCIIIDASLSAPSLLIFICCSIHRSSNPSNPFHRDAPPLSICLSIC